MEKKNISKVNNFSLNIHTFWKCPKPNINFFLRELLAIHYVLDVQRNTIAKKNATVEKNFCVLFLCQRFQLCLLPIKDLKVDRKVLDTTEIHHYRKAWEKEIWQITWAKSEQPGVPTDPVKNEACGLTVQEQNVSLLKCKLDPALNHFCVTDRWGQQLCEKPAWRREEQRGTCPLVNYIAGCTENPGECGCSSTAILWGDQIWGLSKNGKSGHLPLRGAGNPTLPTEEKGDALTLPGEVLQSQMWRRETPILSGTAKPRQGMVEQLTQGDTESLWQQEVFGEGHFSL